MVSAGSYILSAALLAVLVVSLGCSAVCLRKRLIPAWEGAPARLVEAIVGVALLIWLSELLGAVGLFYAWILIAASMALAGGIVLALGPGGRPGWPGRPLGLSPRGLSLSPSGTGEKHDAAAGRATPASLSGSAGQGAGTQAGHRRPVDERAMSLVAIAVVALVFAHWGLTAKDALGRGIFNFDSLWYHMPFAVEMAKSHSVTGLHYTETVFTNWFYPQNSELLHAVGVLLTQRDTLSLFVNFGWLAMAFLAAWCIGRPYGRGPLTVVAAAIVLECHTLVVREPGAAKNDLMAAALLLAAIAILVNAWTGRRLPVGWPLAAAGIAAGLAVGTKSTALAMAAALTVAVVALAPAGRRLAAAGWWLVPAVAGGGFWYLRNLIVVGNPLPQLESLGPISLPHPERLQGGRPDFSIAHYATDTGVWSEYFAPGLHQAFGLLWPLVVGGAIAGGLVALLWGRERVLRWIGGVVLFGLLAYVFTPLSAAGAEGAPIGFAINIRYAIPALLAGLTLLPLALGLPWPSASSAGGGGEGYRGTAAPSSSPLWRSRTTADAPGEKPSEAPVPLPPDRTRGWIALSLLVLVLLVTNRADAVLRDPDRLFAWVLALLLVLIPAALLWWRGAQGRRDRDIGGSGGARAARGPGGQAQAVVMGFPVPTRAGAAVAAGFAVLALAIAAIGYPLQRDYLHDRFANDDPATAIPGMHLDSAYRWARDVSGARTGLAGTTAGFLGYGFYGTDLSNRVRYLGVEGPHGGFDPIPDCRAFRAAVNAAELDYLVTAPFLNFIETDDPVRSPEAGWLRGEPAANPIERSGPVTVWRLRGPLDPTACGPRNAPLRYVPQQPSTTP